MRVKQTNRYLQDSLLYFYDTWESNIFGFVFSIYLSKSFDSIKINFHLVYIYFPMTKIIHPTGMNIDL